MIADAVEVRHNRPRKHRLRYSNSNRSDLLSNSEVVVRNNVKRVAPNVRLHLGQNVHHDRHSNSSHEASVSQHQRDLSRRRSRNRNVRRKRRNSNSLSRSAVILERAKARNHKT